MNIISIHSKSTQQIKKAQKGDRLAQKAIYDTFSPKMLSVCRMYIKDLHHAEDTMMKGFLKCFTHLKDYQFNGSFEGWIRRIMVNECISFLRVQKNKFNYLEIESVELKTSFELISHPYLEAQEIQYYIDQLPAGCRTVFNLFVIEGYGHEEIAESLGISASTSRSQLFHAKKLLRDLISKHNQKQNG